MPAKRLFALVALMSPLLTWVPPRHASTAAPAKRYAVIIVADGARPDFFNLAHMPNLRNLVTNGASFSRAIVGQEIANTPPSHATIGTGVFPRRHGIEGFAWKSPVSGTAFRPTDLAAVRGGALERIMADHSVPSIAKSIKLSDSADRVEAVSGHKCYAADAMGTAAADYILCANIYHGRWVAQAIGYHRPPPGAINNPRWDVPIPAPADGFSPAVEQWKLGAENQWTVDYALWAFKAGRYPRLLMINLPESDVIGHFVVDGAPDLDSLARAFDRDVGKIVQAYRSAGLLARTDFFITSDHGMSRIESRLPFSVLDRAVALAGAKKVYLEADMGAAIGIAEPQLARPVARLVSQLGGDQIDAAYFKVRLPGQWLYRSAYVRSDLPYYLRRAYLALAQTVASESGPDVLVDYTPHVTTGDRIANGYHWLAGHLGPHWDEQHIPLIISGPGVKSHCISAGPARLVDIAPTVETLLRIDARGTDGFALAECLTRPTTLQTVQRRAESALWSPLVAAMQQRSGT